MRTKVFAAILFIVSFMSFMAQTAWSEDINCIMCHPDKAEGKSVHAAVGMGCASCHGGVDASAIPHKITGSVPKGLMAEGADLCYMCHDKANFTGKQSMHMPVSGGMCTSCHDAHSSKFDKLLLSETVCFTCHDKTGFDSKKYVHPPVAGGMCMNCHKPHQSDSDNLLTTAVPDVCYHCHDKTQFFGQIVHAPVGLGMCNACHSPHQSDKAKLLSMESKDLCYSCHDKNLFMLKGSVHKPIAEGRCLSCHQPHAGKNESLVYRKGNILCRGCHPNVERTPHAIGGFQAGGHPVRGRQDPNRPGQTFGCLSCHVPHSSEWPSLFRYKAKDMFGMCTFCHEY